jgi:hypothetical protein
MDRGGMTGGRGRRPWVRPRCPAAGRGEIALKGARNVVARITAPGRFQARPPLARVRVAQRGLTALAAAAAGTLMVTGCQIGSDSAPAHQATGSAIGSHQAARPRIRHAADVGSGPTCSHHGCDNTDPIQTGCADGSQYTVVSVPVKLGGGTVVATINLRYSPTQAVVSRRAGVMVYEVVRAAAEIADQTRFANRAARFSFIGPRVPGGIR